MNPRTAKAVWEGDLKTGKGMMDLHEASSGFTFDSRFGDASGGNPEILLAAAHAGCFSMQLAGVLGKAGFKPARIETTARISLTKSGEGFAISTSELTVDADVPNIDEETFAEKAMTAKDTCPVSRALAGVEIRLSARLARKAA